MTRTMKQRPTSSRPNTIFVLSWALLALIHGIVFLMQLNQASFYEVMPGSQVDQVLSRYGIGSLPTFSKAIVAIYIALGILHSLALLQMIVNSLRARRLTFFRLNPRDPQVCVPKLDLSCLKRCSSSPGIIPHVESESFDAYLLLQELIETSLQTYQVYRLNRFARRLWIKRLYTGTLVLRCWWLPWIHAVYRRDTRRQRMLSVLSDCLLDFTASLVVPIALSFNYDSAISEDTRSISMSYLYDDERLVTMTSEYQLVMGSSWVDIINRSVFTISLLAGMQTAKQLLELAPEQGIHPAINTAPSKTILRIDARIEANKRPQSCRLNLVRLPWMQLLHTLLILWGVVLATFHFRAEFRSVNHSSCPIVLRPWLGSNEIPCPLLVTDCNQASISGFEYEIQALWEPIELTQVLRLVFRHCSNLEIPSAIGRFTSIKSIKVYNSTIVRWDDSVAALSSGSHPLLRSLQFVRTMFTRSELPTGLWGPTFPLGVTVVEFCVTNLAELPSLVSSRWPRGLRLVWEDSTVMSVPSVLYALNLTQLSLARNPLASISGRIFEIPSLQSFSIAYTPLSRLPSDVSLASTLEQISIVESAVSDMPSWFYDDLLNRPRRWASDNRVLVVGGSVYCHVVGARTVADGDRIDCASKHDDVSYPLDQEDAQSAVSIQS